MAISQEKFQITIPYSKTAGETDGKNWASFESQRNTSGNVQPGNASNFNRMPTLNADDGRAQFVKGFGGDTDVSGDVEPSSMLKGYKRLDMSPTSDIYDGEHVDLFYGEAVDENGKPGFLERNNYLDRT